MRISQPIFEPYIKKLYLIKMKKSIILKAFMAVFAICSVALLTSCDKEEEQPEKVNQLVPMVSVDLSEAVLDLYDVTLVLKNSGMTKELTLIKDSAEVADVDYDGTTINYYNFTSGDMGVNSLEAKVTPKADIEARLKSMPQGVDIPMVLSVSKFDAIFYEADKYYFENYVSQNSIHGETPEDMLSSKEDMTEYEGFAIIIADFLSMKK